MLSISMLILGVQVDCIVDSGTSWRALAQQHSGAEHLDVHSKVHHVGSLAATEKGSPAQHLWSMHGCWAM